MKFIKVYTYNKAKFYSIQVIVLLFFLSCNLEKSNFEKAMQYSETMKVITDSLLKIKTYNVDLLICSYSNDSEYSKLMFENPGSTYSISMPFYDYKRISGIDILFVDYYETEKSKVFEKVTFSNEEIKGRNYHKIQHLVKNGKITFGKKFTNYPFYKFVFCNKNKDQIKCFDNLMESNAYNKSYKEGKVYKENIFYPVCE
ncbi:MAG: hypothetical protein RSF68_03580 [Myroides sp.]